MANHATSSPEGADQHGPRAQKVIEPASERWFPDLLELRHHVDLVYFLAKRDVSVRYKQTAVGALWAVLQPLMLAGVFSLFLGRLNKVPSEGAPYAVFALTGMTLWLFVSTAISRCSESTLQSSELISKVYFPRVAIPLAAIMPPVIDFVASFVVLFVVLLIAGVTITLKILLVPVVFAVAVAVVLGLGLWLSATVVRYRDVSQIVGFMTLVLLFVTPILYPLSRIPHTYRAIYALNPLVGIFESFRWSVLPHAPAPGALLLISAGAGVLLLVTGLAYFHRAERSFADVI